MLITLFVFITNSCYGNLYEISTLDPVFRFTLVQAVFNELVLIKPKCVIIDILSKTVEIFKMPRSWTVNEGNNNRTQ